MSDHSGEKKNETENMQSGLSAGRRNLLTTLGWAGAGGLMFSLYQNCAQSVGPLSLASSSSSAQGIDTTLTASPGVTTIAGLPVKNVMAGTDQDIQVGFYKATHYSHSDGTSNHVQFLLNVIVGRSRTLSHPTNWAQTPPDAVAFITVYDRDTGNLLYMRRLSEGNIQPEATFLLDALTAQSGRTVSVVMYNPARGFFRRDVVLSSSTCVPYAEAVAPYDANKFFGGNSPDLPYIAGTGNASGGQGDLGAVHYPQVLTVDRDTVRVIVGGPSPHGRFAENHYIHAIGLYDQNGNEIAPIQNLVYADTTNFSRAQFDGLKLPERGVRILRAVAYDTYNGHLMGFASVT